jgi:hypothetical protein
MSEAQISGRENAILRPMIQRLSRACNTAYECFTECVPNSELEHRDQLQRQGAALSELRDVAHAADLSPRRLN